MLTPNTRGAAPAAAQDAQPVTHGISVVGDAEAFADNDVGTSASA